MWQINVEDRRVGDWPVLLNPVLSLVKNRELVRETAIRELKSLNKGSALGNLWLFLRPLLQTGAYVIIVAYVFKMRLRPDSSPLDYATYVLSGMVPWQLVVQAIAASPSLVRGQVTLVKQVVYPIETLPLTNLAVAMFTSLVTFGLYLLLALKTGTLQWTCLLLPIPFLLFVIFTIGISWILMMLGVLFKDLREVVSIIVSLLVFMSPVLTSRQMVGDATWRFILCNPLAHIIICFRDVFNSEYHPTSWLIFVAMAFSTLLVGGYVVSRTRLMVNEYI